MQLRSTLATGLLCAVGLVNAEFIIVTTTYQIQTSIKDSSDVRSSHSLNNTSQLTPSLQVSRWVTDIGSKAASALSTYAAQATADPQYASVTAAVDSILATRTDVAPAVTASDTTTTIQSIPPWYTALPSDIRSYYSSIERARRSIFEEVINAAPRPTAGTGFGGAAGFVAAGALGAGALLF